MRNGGRSKWLFGWLVIPALTVVIVWVFAARDGVVAWDDLGGSSSVGSAVLAVSTFAYAWWARRDITRARPFGVDFDVLRVRQARRLIIRDRTAMLPFRWEFRRDAEESSAYDGEGDVALTVLGTDSLVILGEPGSGKTTLAIGLARQALEGTYSSLPVLLQLSDWNPPEETFDSWFVAGLAAQLGVPRKEAAESLAGSRRVLVVLDGLDELPAAQRSVVVGWLSRRRARSGLPFVLTCRTTAYEQVEGVETRQLSTLTLRPPTAVDIARWLSEHGDEGARWEPVARSVVRDPSGPLAEGLASRWILRRAVDAYSSRDPAELTDETRFPTPEAVRQRILETAHSLVEFAHWSGAEGRRWLENLTHGMNREGDVLLLWWRLAERDGRRSLRGVLRWLLLGVPYLYAVSLPGRGEVAVLLALLAAAMLIGAPLRSLEPRRVRLWRKEAAVGALGGAGLSAGVLGAVALRDGGQGPLIGTIGTVAVTALAGLALGIVKPDRVPVDAEDLPGDGRVGDLRADRSAALLKAFAVTALTCVPLAHWLRAVDPGDEVAVGTCVAFGTFLSTLLDGSAWGHYHLTHARLCLRGRLPWRLARFVAEARAVGVLVQAPGFGAGCHVFRHDLVRETLAARGAPRDAGSRAVRAARREMVEEVLALPESVAYIAYGSGPHTSVREHVADMAGQALDEDLPTVTAAGAAAYERFREARRRMVEAVREPLWARPPLARAYRITMVVAAPLALAAWGLELVEAVVLVGGGLALGAGAFVVRLVRDGTERTTGNPRGGEAGVRPAYDAVRQLLSLLVVAGPGFAVATWVADLLTDDKSRNAVFFGSFVVVVFSFLAWTSAQPYVLRQVGLASDDPADWPELPPGRARYRDAAAQAHRDWLTAVARDGVMPLLRNRLRVGQDPTAVTLPNIDPSRLTGTRRSDQFVTTAAAERTDLLLQELESAGIGVSGPRGAGKSSLMQRFCGPDSVTAGDDLLVLVPAPTSYDPREFLIHLFTEVCRKITGETGATGVYDPERRATRLKRTLAAIALTVGVVTILVGAFFGQLTEWAGEMSVDPPSLVLLSGAVLTVGGVLWTRSLTGARQGEHARRTGGAEAAAARHLRALQYQLTVMRTRNAQLALPAGLQLAGGEQIQHTEHLLGYPELVAQFRALLDVAALERRSLGGRVVIGIDELDKVGTAEEAERFLNDLKVVFGIRGVHFLVAVSEDALTAFGRHVLDVRTAFDSSFDRVVAVPPLGLGQARALLELRGVWLPERFLWLCQLLSGGLPRDLLRAVMSLVTARTLRGIDQLNQLAHELITEDATAVLSAQSRYVATLVGDGAGDAVRWTAEASQAPVSADSWEELIRRAPRPPSMAEYETVRAVAQVRAYLYFGATLLRIFTGPQKETVLDHLWDAAPEPLDRLAPARVKLATEPAAAWSAVERFRAEVRGLAPLT